jgi:GAF domain-containing protein
MNESAKRKQDMLTSILNGISAMIYVTELETDKILFINDYMKQQFGIEGDVVGQPCYKVLNQGIEERCEWCPCHQLDKEPEIEVVWEELNTLTGCHYRNADRYIDWPSGKKVHIQLCIDISDVKQMQEELEKQNNLLQAVNESATHLLNTKGNESYLDDVHQSMKVIGEAAKVSRVYVWKNHLLNEVLHSTQIYEWNGDAEPQQNNEYTVNMPYEETLPGLLKTFFSNQSLNGIVSQLPLKYQAHMYPQNIVSIIMVPIFTDEQLWGFVGFDDCHNERVFTEKEESTLRSAGLLYAHAHQRNEIVKNIQETSEKLMRSNELLEAINNVAAILLDINIEESIRIPIMSSMEIIGDSICVDRVHIWRMHIINGEAQFIHEYQWLSEEGKTKSEVPMGLITPFVKMAEWKSKFMRNEYVGGPLSELSIEEQEYFIEFDVKSVVLIPIFLDEQLWGLVSLDDCVKERDFSEDELSLLQSLSLMIASAIERHDLFIKDKKSKERMMLMLLIRHRFVLRYGTEI